MPGSEGFDAVVEQYHHALGEFVKGNPEPLKVMYSRRDDATLANPFGPTTRGWKQCSEAMDLAASHYRDGEVIGFENTAGCVTADLAYIVEVERYEARIGGREEASPLALRVTSILRPEDGTWKVIHRHADTITTVRGAESIVQD